MPTRAPANTDKTPIDLISDGLRQKLIRFEDDKKYVIYVDQAKRRRYDAPEEQVQVRPQTS